MNFYMHRKVYRFFQKISYNSFINYYFVTLLLFIYIYYIYCIYYLYILYTVFIVTLYNYYLITLNICLYT